MSEYNLFGRLPSGKKQKKETSLFGDGFSIGIKPSKKQASPYSTGIGIGPSHKKEERDTRRNFSQTQRNEIWDRQKGKCAGSICRHKPLLRSATHYDHIIPWEKNGKTIVSNGQALCPTCHAVKSNKDRLKDVDKKRKSKSGNNPFGGSLFKFPRKRSKYSMFIF